MKKTAYIVLGALILLTQTTFTKEPSWLGTTITNKTEYQLKVSVCCTEACDHKKDKDCNPPHGYVLLVQPNQSIINKKTNNH